MRGLLLSALSFMLVLTACESVNRDTDAERQILAEQKAIVAYSKSVPAADLQQSNFSRAWSAANEIKSMKEFRVSMETKVIPALNHHVTSLKEMRRRQRAGRDRRIQILSDPDRVRKAAVKDLPPHIARNGKGFVARLMVRDIRYQTPTLPDVAKVVAVQAVMTSIRDYALGNVDEATAMQLPGAMASSKVLACQHKRAADAADVAGAADGESAEDGGSDELA